MPVVQIINRSNDHLIKLTGLQDASDDSYVNNATVTLTVKTLAGVNVSGVSWPLTLVYVSASDGNYQVVIDKAIVLVLRDRYVAEVTVVAGSRDAFFEVPVQAQVRES